jgi:hypothetical protein
VIKLNSLDVAQQKVLPVLATHFHISLKFDSSLKWRKTKHFAVDKNLGKIMREVFSFLQVLS